MKNKLAYIFFLVTFFAFTRQSHAQYLHQSGKKIVDGSGNEIILRGMGLGGWMLQEGYMLEMSSFANPQHQIRAKIQELIGETNTNEFYEAWYQNHCTKRDIDSLAAWGFNSVRLPLHYNLFTLPIEKEPAAGTNTWLTKGFEMVDNVLSWCEANQLYLILDLHAAPGGQGNDAAISDYDNTKPSLWESEANRNKTVALWKKLAERYADKPWIGGYDLINETNWNFTPGAHKNGCDEKTNEPLVTLLKDITTAIRSVDQNHIIFLEGNCWANNHNGFFPLWDNNLAISFHKYWNYNDEASLADFIKLRNQHNVPLWLGESGENSNTWFTNAISLMEKNGIGWAWWPMKKVGSIVNPLTIVKTEAYDQLLNYWKNGGTKPTESFAKATLMQLTENLKIENCIYRKDVIDAMFRQVNDHTTIPFKKHVIPGVVHLSDFDLGRYNKAYYDKDTANYSVATGSYANWNNGWVYRNDGVDIERNTDSDVDGNNHNIGWTENGEWLLFTLTVDSTAAYTIAVRYATPSTTSGIKLNIDGEDKTSAIILPSTDGYNVWNTHVINDIVFNKGKQKLKFIIQKGGANISYLKFTLSKKVSELPFKPVGAETSVDGKTLKVVLNKKINPSTLSKNGFSAMVNEAVTNILEVKATSGNNGLAITIDKTLTDTDNIKLNYNEDTVKDTDGALLEDFTNLIVVNTMPFHALVPGVIEAESFTVNQGLALESTSDTGGGQNIGYTNAGDYLEYRIYVAEEGEYKVEARIACFSQAGKLEIKQFSTEHALLNTATLNVPVTGGWQTWQTVSTKISLKKGSSILRVSIVQPEFNINWFKFTYEPVVIGIEKNKQGLLTIFPNPAEGLLNIEMPEYVYRDNVSLVIRDHNGAIVKRIYRKEKQDFRNINVSGLSTGLYLIELETKGTLWRERFLIKEPH
jgi:endoglucanase